MLGQAKWPITFQPDSLRATVNRLVRPSNALIVKKSSLLVNRPTAWPEYRRLRKSGVPAVTMGLVGHVNRFSARYRLTRSFTGISLPGYSESTVRTYSALFRLLLSWSTAELYFAAVGTTQRSFSTSALRVSTDALLVRLRTLDPGYVVFRRVISHLTSAPNKAEVASFISGVSCNPTYLASAMRHAFAHGPLPAVPTGVPPALLSSVCEALSDFLINLIDADFTERVTSARA